MRYILFFIILTTLLTFFYLSKKENFIVVKDSDKYQLLSYIPKNDYNADNDAGIMNDFEKNVVLKCILNDSNDSDKNIQNCIDYQNLDKKIIFNTQEQMTDDEILNLISKNLNYDSKIEIKSNKSIQKRELSLIQIDAILNIILLNNRFRPENHKLNLKKEENEITKYSYSLVKIEEISRAASSDFFKNKYIYSFNFKSENDKIISYKVDYENNFEEYEFQMIIYRENRDINYTIYVNILLDHFNMKYYLKKIFIIGVNTSDKIYFNNLFNNPKGYISKNWTSKKFDTQNKINDYLKNVKEKREIDRERDRGFCFFKRNVFNKIHCESVDEDGTGVWDKPCTYDEDCPFYKRNRNYPNNRGGCKKGFCEMPVNLKRFGFKQINDNKLDDIICYNCKRDKNSDCVGLNCNKCCEEQKDKTKYPTLNSPDYAFDFDFEERINNVNSFKKKNISPIKLIS